MATHVVQRSRWALCFVSILLLFTAIVAGGCGRSALDEALVVDGGTEGGTDAPPDQTDGGSCGPATCPSGCCDANGACRAGTDLQACGNFGQKCAQCATLGFDVCDARAHACGHTVGSCNPKTCQNGCCENNVCLAGGDPNECGRGGLACNHCAARGLACDAFSGQCTGTACGPATCNGCCVGDVCVPGADGTACGRGGQQCQNCSAQGTVCQPTPPSGGICEGNPFCGPQNCKGCCQGNLCNPGTDGTACGLAGQQCQNCSAIGETCQIAGPGGFCSPSSCGPQNCKGCCLGDQCLSGFDTGACGFGGDRCQPCPPGGTCSGGVCIGNFCNPATCNPGCCLGDLCAVGDSDNACGAGGFACSNCAAQGLTCEFGKCLPPQCGPQNCKGCCAGNQCIDFTSDTQCGTSGQACANCTALGDVCRTGLCVPPPTCANCAQLNGCCDPVLGCVGGFVNDRCGSGGAACVDCTAQGSTCDTAVTPRTCSNQQVTCPAPYLSCPPGVTTVPPNVQHVCATTDLQDARAACSGGPATPGCISFFQFIAQSNPACNACLKPFDVPFQDATGIFDCVAPFVDPTCDHSTGCAVDCVNTSCSQCPPGAFIQCRNDVRNNQCGPYFQASQCIGQALFGAASFCNPGNGAYRGNFGAWLEGVGGHYCGP